MKMPKRLRIAAWACTIVGFSRLVAGVHALETGRVSDFGITWSLYFAFVMAASFWQLFVGVLGLVFWRHPGKWAMLTKAAVRSLLFDVAFLFIGGITFIWIFMVMDQWPGILILLVYGFLFAMVYTSGIGKLRLMYTEPEKPDHTFQLVVSWTSRVVIGFLVATIIGFGIWFVEIGRENIPIEEAIPWGTWESQNPPVTLFIEPSLQVEPWGYTFPALYRQGDEAVPIYVYFSTDGGMIGNYRAHRMQIGRRGDPVWIGSTGDGFFVVGDTLHFITHDGQELQFERM